MGEPIYDLRLLSETGGSVRSSMGFTVATEPLSNANFDTLMVGGSAVAGSLTPGVTKFLRRALTHSRRVASTCTGAFVLAEAGLLDGRRATTHWHRARDLQARFPMVKVRPEPRHRVKPFTGMRTRFSHPVYPRSALPLCQALPRSVRER
jgi:transcriptional regulator GlxA family with amidase domain